MKFCKVGAGNVAEQLSELLLPLTAVLHQGGLEQ